MCVFSSSVVVLIFDGACIAAADRLAERGWGELLLCIVMNEVG